MATTLPYTKTAVTSLKYTDYSLNDTNTVTVTTGISQYSFGNGADVYNFTTQGGITTNWQVISGGNGADVITGSAYNDVIWGDSYGNSSTSDNGSDTLAGGAGNDQIHGGNGVDTLQGDKGADQLWGDRGGDTFKYVTLSDSNAVSGAWSRANGDTIIDFTASEGDKIDLAGLKGSITGAGAPDMLTWSTGARAYGVWASGGILYADVNGDTTADFAVRVLNGSGAAATIVSANVGGLNHDPVGVNDTASATEDTVVTGNLRTNDSDSDGNTLTYVPRTSVAGLTINANGTWSFNAGNAAYQSLGVNSLGVGETATVSVTVDVKDGHGGTAVETLKITVTGTNDGPVITSEVQSGDVAEDGTATVSGQVTASDIDAHDVLTYATSDTAAHGTFHLDATTGAWSYDLDNASVQSLGAGETLTETFTVTVSDGHGATATQDVKVTINGTNDGPEVTSGVQSGEVTEDSPATATGQVTASDVDTNDVLSYATSDVAAHGTFNLDAESGAWSYELDSAGVQSLGVGETLTETFTVTVSDGNGGSDTQVVTVTINGTNDGPEVTSGVQSGEVTEDSPATATGQVTASDVDTNDVLSYATSDVAVHGTFNLDAESGAWSYELDSAGVQSLGVGETLTETFTVTVTDDHGATATQDVKVTITGTNDTPVITSGVQSGDVAEDGTATVSGQVTASDVDTSDELTYATSDTAAHGTFNLNATTGAWSYDLDNASVQSLGAGETLTETFTVTVSDGQGGTVSQDVTVKITGTNDTPVIAAATTATGLVTEDTATSVGCQIVGADVDHDAVLGYTGSHAGTYGSFVVDATTGEWTYTLGSASQALAQGESHDETFTVTVTDDQGATATKDVTVSVHGTNDAPTGSSTATLTAGTEDTDYTVTKAQLLAGFSDADNGETASLSVANFAVTHGTFTANPDGSYTIHPDANYNGSVAITYQVADVHNATANGSLSLSIAAVNDNPVITAPGAGADQAVNYAENGTGAVATVTAGDVDGDTVTFSLTGADKDLFTITNGVLAFKASPDFETPKDVGADNTYNVNVVASDGHGGTDSQAYTINVTDVAESLNPTDIIFTMAAGTGTAASQGQSLGANNLLGSFGAVDADSSSWTYSLSNNTAGVSFSSTAVSTSAISVANASLYLGTAGLSAGTYAFTLTANDGHGGSYNETFTVRVGTTQGDQFTIVTGASSTGSDLDFGLNGADALQGGDGDDALAGGASIDTIDGGNGNDQIYGGAADDVLTGGAGNDRFIFADTNEGTDRITDFQAHTSLGSAGDLIDVSVIDPNSGLAGDQAFTFGGTTATARGVWYVYDAVAGVTHVNFDTNGNTGNVEFQINLTGNVALHAYDFVL
jgi:VCBS repeat-containing protein